MLLHALAITALVTIPMHVLHPPTFITLTPLDPDERSLPPYAGTRASGGPPGGVGPTVPPGARGRGPGATPHPDTVVPAPLPDRMPWIARGPMPGDGRVWVSPRPALPRRVADALYGTPDDPDSVAVRRLRAMVDSLNILIDAMQRERQRPTWTKEVAGRKFGIDSQFIHIAGIKIPVFALNLLPIAWPEANWGEMERAEQLRGMREDLLQSARRTETLRDFRRYVGELRARKDAEREAARRLKPPPDTAAPTAVP